MRWKNLIGCVIIVVILCTVLFIHRSQGTKGRPLEDGRNLEPLEIYVCMGAPGDAEHPESLLWKGIQEAHSSNDTLDGLKVELIWKDPGEQVFDNLDSVREFVRKEGISGPLLFRSSRAFSTDAGYFRDSGAFITLVPSAKRLLAEGQGCAVQIGSSLRDRASAAALFARNTLKADDAVIVLDQDAPDSVFLASLFSSELVRLGGAVSEVCILPGQDMDLKGVVQSILQKSPGVVYMPYSERSALSLIESLLKQGQRSPAVMVSSPWGRGFLSQGGEALEGTYLVTDSHLRPCRSESIWGWIERLAGASKDREYEEPLEALGRDAYLTLLGLLQDGEQRGYSTDERRSDSGEERQDGTDGLPCSSGQRQSIYIYRVETGLFRAPHLVHLESIDPAGSDLGADVMAQ